MTKKTFKKGIELFGFEKMTIMLDIRAERQKKEWEKQQAELDATLKAIDKKWQKIIEKR